MTQFPNTSPSLPFDPRSNIVEANSSRRDNQSAAGSSEGNRFSRALDDSSTRSDARTDAGRDDTQVSTREGSPRDNDLLAGSRENAAPENTGDQRADTELSNDETEAGSLEATVASEQDTTEQSDAALFDPFSLIQQLTNETTSASTDAVATEGSLLASTAITGFLPNGEIASGITTPQQNVAGTLLDAATTPQQGGQPGQLGQAGQNLATQINGALAQTNNIAGGVIGDTFETVLTTQSSNASTQAAAQNPTSLQQNIAASGLQTTQLGDGAQQTTNPNAGANTSPNTGLNPTSSEGEQFGSLANSNQSTATPSQQLASLLSGGTNADVTLPNQGQLANSQLQQAVQPQPVQQAAQPVAQFANTAFADDTLPAFTAQISRNFAAGQDSFNVKLNPSELGRVDVRVINNDDGTVSTQIRVERSETLDLFQRDIRALERTLQQSGVKLGSDGIDLSLKDNGADQGGNNQAFDNDFNGQGEHAQNSDPALEADDTNQHLDNDGLLVDDLTADIPIDQVQTIYARYQPGQLNIRV